jgi:hypothetical protein
VDDEGQVRQFTPRDHCSLRVEVGDQCADVGADGDEAIPLEWFALLRATQEAV